MRNVSIRDLRNRGGDIVDLAARGEEIRITRAGKPVATLSPIAREPLSREALLERWKDVKPIDAGALRRDLDAVIDSRL